MVDHADQDEDLDNTWYYVLPGTIDPGMALLIVSVMGVLGS